jgi:hypothetical protein
MRRLRRPAATRPFHSLLSLLSLSPSRLRSSNARIQLFLVCGSLMALNILLTVDRVSHKDTRKWKQTCLVVFVQ